MNKPIINPPIPYIGVIRGSKFNPGKILKIQGLAPGFAYRFDINLQCGPETEDDVALQISVRLLDGHISLNSLQQGIWGEEQIGRIPLERNENFEIAIQCDINQYKVFINGEHYSEFPQRIHHSRITHLGIDGDVSIVQIVYEGNNIGISSRSELVDASAPLLTPSMNNGRNHFEYADEITNRPSQLGRRSPRQFMDGSEPPSYDAAVEASSRPPYPTGHSVRMPIPTIGSVTPYPTNSLSAPYPRNTSGAPYPASGPVILPLNTTAGMPTTESYAYQRARKARWRHRGYVIGGVVVGGILVVILVVGSRALIRYLVN